MPTWTAGTKTLTAYVWSTLGAPTVVNWAINHTANGGTFHTVSPIATPIQASLAPSIGQFTLDSIDVTDTGETDMTLGSKYAIEVEVSYPASFFPRTGGSAQLDQRFPGELFNIYLASPGLPYSSFPFAARAGVGYDESIESMVTDYDVTGTVTGSVTRTRLTVAGDMDVTPLATPVDSEITHWAWQGRSETFNGPFRGPGGAAPNFAAYPFDYFAFDETFNGRPLPEYADIFSFYAYAWDNYGRLYSSGDALEAFAIPGAYAAGVIDAHGDLYSAAVEWDNSSNPKFPIRCATALQTASIETISDFTPPVEWSDPQEWNDDISQVYGDNSTLILDDSGNLNLHWRWDVFWYALRSLNSGKFGPISADNFGNEFRVWPTYPYSTMQTMPLQSGIAALAIDGLDLKFTISPTYNHWPENNISVPVIDVATLTYGDERDDYGAPMRGFSLLTQNDEKGSWLYATDGVDFLFESRDFGDSWQAKTLNTDWQRPFNPDEYGAIRLCALDSGAYGAIAIKYSTGEAWFSRTYNGFMDWTAPVLVMALNDEFPVANICQLKRLGSSMLCAWNGGDVTNGKIALSLNGGGTFTLN